MTTTTITDLTAAEFKTLRTILRNGGNVVACMGRVGRNRVNKLTVERLEAKGYVVSVGAWRSGPSRLDITVTAAGCGAFNAATPGP